MTQPIEKMASLLAQQLWQQGGRIAGHLGLLYTAHKTIDIIDGKQTGFLSWINPLPKLKKVGTWLGLEGAAHGVPVISQALDGSTPIVEKFLTPIIGTMIRPPLECLAEHGYRFYDETETSWTSYLNPLTIAGNAISGTANAIAWPYRTISNYWYGSQPIETSPVYEWLDTNAPEVGQFIANGMKTSFEYAGKVAHFPGNLVQAVAEATGLPYSVVLAGTAALTFYATRACWTTVTQTVVQKQSTKVDATAQANANMGGVHIHLPQYDATKKQTSVPSDQKPIVPVVILPGEGKDNKLQRIQ